MPTIEATDPPEDANAAAKAESSPAVKKKSPNSSPKKAGDGGPPTGITPAKAKASERKKPEPTLLHDFLRGRPSASRPTASRPRRKSSAMAPAEMRASAVNKLTPPAKVKNRVMEWQKASRGAGAPEVSDLEEPAPEEDEDKKPAPTRSQSMGPRTEEEEPAAPVEIKKAAEAATRAVKPKASTARKPKKATLETSMPPVARGAQMKRVVSDTHWVNKSVKKETPVVKDPIFNLLLNSGAVKKAVSPRAAPPKASVPKAPAPKKLPKDFVETNWANPPVERKIQDWVKRSAEASANGQEEDAEAAAAYAEAVKEAQDRGSASRGAEKEAQGRRSASRGAEKEAQGRRSASRGAEKADVPGPSHVNPSKPLSGPKERVSPGGREKERQPSPLPDKPAILPEKAERVRRVRAARPEEIAAALGLKPPPRTSPRARRDVDKRYVDTDDRRRLPSYGAGRANGRDGHTYHDDDAESYDRPYAHKQRNREATSARRRSVSPDHDGSGKRPVRDDREPPRREQSRHQQRRPRDEATTVTASTLSTLTSDSEDTISDTASVRPDDMRSASKRSLHGKKSLDEIPVGYSAFSVLDLSSGGHPRSKPAKPQRKGTLVGVPNVLKRVYNEGMKIMQDTVDPPRIVINNPPNIESWLNGTSDPFLDDPSKGPAGSQRKPTSSEQPRRERSLHQQPPLLGGERSPAEQAPVRTKTRRVSSDKYYDDKEARDYSRRSSITNSTMDATVPLDKPSESHAVLKRRPARRENSSPFTGRKSTRDLRNPELHISPARDLNSYADNLSRDSRRDSRGQESGRGKDAEALASNRHTSPRIDTGWTGPQSLKGNGSGRDKTEAPELTRHSRLRRIPSSGPSERPPLWEGRFSDVEPESGLKKPPSGLPSRYISKKAFEGPGLRRRLTKHSDLMSMLSLPDTNVQRGPSIAPARSIRTKRAPLDSGDVNLILCEVTADEEKYLRELTTLVDGVIPVLLGSVLARSDSTALSRNSPSKYAINSSITKPLVDIGEALEQLRDLHTQIPTKDSKLLILWLSSAHGAYNEYLQAWRLGFDDIVVNLAPASRNNGLNHSNASTMKDRTAAMDTETVDVAYLLRRPLVRVKYLAKAAKGLYLAHPTEECESVLKLYEALVEKARLRTKQENARKQDIFANTTDTTKARDLRTLAPADSKTVKILQSRQVKAVDYFDLSLNHTNGQRLVCEVEMIVRDGGLGDGGDVLMCEVDDRGRQWLLFQPVEMDCISARTGESMKELVVMIRGHHHGKDWAEIVTLQAETAEVAQDFIELLGSTPLPPFKSDDAGVRPPTPITPRSAMMSGALPDDMMEYPIGERAPGWASTIKQSSSQRVSDWGTDHVYDKDGGALKADTRTREVRSMPYTTTQPSTSSSKTQSKHGKQSKETRPQAERRPPSPLKKEYKPHQQQESSGIDTTDFSGTSESELTDVETEDDLPPIQIPNPTQDSTPRSTPPPTEGYCLKFAAYLTCWRHDMGRYENLHPEICSVRVTPGNLKVMVMDSSHSAPDTGREYDGKRPLVELELTPLTYLAQRTGLDVEIRAAPLESSLLRVEGFVRLRTKKSEECAGLYRACEQARKDNTDYKRLEQERIISGYGQEQPAETIEVEESQGRRSFFSRKKSYRASARAPTVDSGSSKFSFRNAFTAFDRFKKDNHTFDIDKSSMRSGGFFGRSPGNSRASSFFYTGDTFSHGYDPSFATTATNGTAQFDMDNIRIRLYIMDPYVKMRHRMWLDMGEYKLSIDPAPPGMKEDTVLDNGFQTRIQLAKIKEPQKFRLGKALGVEEPEITFDQVMGARCFTRAGRTGVAMQVYHELVREDGRPRARGGSCGRQVKFLFQSRSAHHSQIIFARVGAGGGAFNFDQAGGR